MLAGPGRVRISSGKAHQDMGENAPQFRLHFGGVTTGAGGSGPCSGEPAPACLFSPRNDLADRHQTAQSRALPRQPQRVTPPLWAPWKIQPSPKSLCHDVLHVSCFFTHYHPAGDVSHLGGTSAFSLAGESPARSGRGEPRDGAALGGAELGPGAGLSAGVTSSSSYPGDPYSPDGGGERCPARPAAGSAALGAEGRGRRLLRIHPAPIPFCIHPTSILLRIPPAPRMAAGSPKPQRCPTGPAAAAALRIPGRGTAVCPRGARRASGGRAACAGPLRGPSAAPPRPRGLVLGRPRCPGRAVPSAPLSAGSPGSAGSAASAALRPCLFMF